MAQRLMRTLDPASKKARPATDAEKKMMQEVMSTLIDKSLLPASYDTVYDAVPDDKGGTGYKGRLAVYELMLMNDELRRLTAKNADAMTLFDAARAGGFKTMHDDAAEKVALGFTDACLLAADRLLFLAAAEASPDVIDDGAVTGSTLGILSLGSRPAVEALIPLLEPDGRPSRRKAEGICLDPERAGLAFVVVDADDPTTASDLLEVELSIAR